MSERLAEVVAVTLTRTRGSRGAVGLSTVALVFSALLIAIPSPSSAAAVSCDGQTATIIGTSGDDILDGTSDRDVIAGLGGNDIITGLAGEDVLCGGSGDDEIRGGSDPDRMFGGPGEDTMFGGGGNDRMWGGDKADNMAGGNGNDRMYGEAGKDRMSGEGGADIMKGGGGADTLIGGPNPDEIFGGSGNDMCAGNTEHACEQLAYDYKFKRFLINQAVPAADSAQNANNRVGTVEMRPGIVRAYITGNQPNIPSPTVHLYWKIDGVVGKSLMTGPATLPQVALDSDLSTTFNYEFDETLLKPGATMYVVVDRHDKVLETKETNNRYPSSGWQNIDTRDVPKLKITVVPVDGMSLSQSQAEALFDKTMRVHPVANWDINVRAPYVCQTCVGSWDWQTLLGEILTLQQSENINRMYHAIVPQAWASNTGIGGIGFLGWPAAVSFPNEETIAHETGHNLTLRHNECSGQEASPDPAFPYTGGWIGNWGYDIADGSTYDPTVYVDLMTYCSPEWVSDFSYGKVLDYRSSGGYDIFAEGLAAAGTGTVTRFTGTVQADVEATASYEIAPQGKRLAGTATNEIKSIEAVSTGLALPKPGDHTLVGVDAAGNTVMSVPFTAYAYDHAPGAFFTFAIELSDETLGKVVRWDVVKAGSVLTSRSAG
ncbi:MAG: calcium-binding protein [bacterium]|nr:calcium-binding protein [bacterium]